MKKNQVIQSDKNLLEELINRIIAQFRGDTAKSIAHILGSRIIAHAINLVYGVIIARCLGPEGKGIVTAAFVLPLFFASFGTFGLSVSNVYYIGKNRDKETLLINSLAFILFSSTIIVVGLIIAMPLFKKSYYSGIINLYIVYLTFSMVLFELLRQFMTDFLRGLEKFGKIAYTRIIQDAAKLLSVTIFFVLFGIEFDIVIVTVVLSLFIALCYLQLQIRREVRLVLNKFDFNQFWYSIKYGLKEYLGHLLAKLNVQVDILILAAFIDKRTLGIYAVAMGLTGLFQIIPNSISFVLLPKFVKIRMDKTKSLLMKGILSNSLILIPSFLVFVIVGKLLIIWLYGKEFTDAYTISVILLVGSIFLSIVQIINKYFSGIGKPEIKSIIRGLNLPIKAIAMYFLIKQYGIVGAAWSFVVSTASLLILTIYFYLNTQKENSIKSNFRKTVR